MSGNQYRAVHPSWKALYGEDVFEHEFANSDDERDHVDRGLFEIVPRPYRVLSDQYTVDGAPVAAGEVIEAGFPMDIEQMLLDGGHLERVRRDAKPTVAPAESESTPKKAAAKRTAKESR